MRVKEEFTEAQRRFGLLSFYDKFYGIVMEVSAEETGHGAAIAFGAPGQATAAIAAGGADNGAPGLRPQYHAAYYAAFVLDPDGNNIEAVCHGPD